MVPNLASFILNLRPKDWHTNNAIIIISIIKYVLKQ